MIITLTLNPSIDYIMQVPSITEEDTLRAQSAFNQSGGKGINVSRVLTRLKVPNIAWGYAGGDTGRWLTDLLDDEAVPHDFITVPGATRINLILTELSTHKQIRVSAPGTAVGNSEKHLMKDRFLNLPTDVKIIVLGGSLPPGISASDVRHWIELAQERGIRVIFDADGDVLKEGLQGKPFMIKPNQYELERLTGRPVKGLKDIVAAAQDLIHKGLVEVVVTSEAEAGAVLVTKDTVLTAKAPKVEVMSKVGAGDSMVAGLVKGLLEDAPWEEILRMGIASGTATVMIPGNELGQPHDYEALLSRVQVETATAATLSA